MATQRASAQTVDNKGMGRFTSCFIGQAECDKPFDVTRDPFNSIFIYEGPRSSMPDYKVGHGLAAGMSISECGSPYLAVRAYYFGSDWLFMERLQFLVDGAPSLDLELRSATRQTTAAGVMEFSSVLIATPEQEQALRAISASPSTVARLSGGRGTELISSAVMNAFVQDLRLSIAGFDKAKEYSSSHKANCKTK